MCMMSETLPSASHKCTHTHTQTQHHYVQDKVFIGINDAPESFSLLDKLQGPGVRRFAFSSLFIVSSSSFSSSTLHLLLSFFFLQFCLFFFNASTYSSSSSSAYSSRDRFLATLHQLPVPRCFSEAKALDMLSLHQAERALKHSTSISGSLFSI